VRIKCAITLMAAPILAGFLVSCFPPDYLYGGRGNCPDWQSESASTGSTLAKGAKTSLSCEGPPWYPWKKPPPAAYSFTYTRSCFCMPADIGPFWVTVENGLVTSALYRTTEGDTVAAAGSVQSYALDSIWQQVNNFIGRPHHDFFLRSNPTWGFPDSFFVDQSLMMADDEYGVTVKDFTVLQE